MKILLRHLFSKKLGFVLLLLMHPPVAEVSAQSLLTYERDMPPTMEMMLNAREVFEYEVKYGFLTLGWVDVELLPDTTWNGDKAYHLRTRVRSNNRIPFVGTKIVDYQNLFQYNDRWPYSFVFWRDDVHEEEFNRVRIEFDREADEVRFFERGEPTDTLDLQEPASGGDIIFFYSRLFAGVPRAYMLPVYTEGEMGMVTSMSQTETRLRKYDAFEEPIPTYYSEGRADLDGPFGFNGNFKSWFSADDLRIPVEAHVKIIFGNVKVRLISYERHAE